MNEENSETVFNLSAQALDYTLPDECIACYPLPQRDKSKLLVWQAGKITDSQFRSLADFLPEKSLLVFNNTRVIHARLLFQKATGAAIEIFCLEPYEPSDYQLSFQQTNSCIWICMVGNLKKWKDETLVKEVGINGQTILLKAEKLDVTNGTAHIRFSWNQPVPFASLIEAAGILPIPPYLNRETEADDLERYQTIYSSIDGSVAAPTAGLHFTDSVFHSLYAKKITIDEVTLHVGAGTFKPVKAETIGEHEMHTEHFIVSRKLIEKLKDNINPLIAVGTTSVRTLESLYWLGVQLIQQPDTKPLHVEQWTAYKETTPIKVGEAMDAILKRIGENETISASTQIIIVPGYQFRLIKGMLTNFHQPQSTLLLLIAAWLGSDWEKVYRHALDNQYRFLSYGDSNLYL